MTAGRTKQFTYVVDASVAIKWFSDEEGSIDARDFLRRHVEGKIQLTAPDLLLYEVGNALARGKQLDAESIEDALSFILTSGIRLFSLVDDTMHLAVKMCDKYRLTFYDAAYASLAADLDVPLLSADSKSHQRIDEIRVKIL